MAYTLSTLLTTIPSRPPTYKRVCDAIDDSVTQTGCCCLKGHMPSKQTCEQFDSSTTLIASEGKVRMAISGANAVLLA